MNTDATGHGLSTGLQGTLKERLEGQKTIYLVFDMGEKPVITFTGFWTGGLITAAQNSIAKAYRRRRFKPGLLRKEISTPQEGKGE